MNDEPFGHRGHPTEHETRRARKLARALDRVVAYLQKEGLTRDEAIGFIAGTALSKGRSAGETWANESSAFSTILNLLNGHASKDWAIDAVVVALFEISVLWVDESAPGVVD